MGVIAVDAEAPGASATRTSACSSSPPTAWRWRSITRACTSASTRSPRPSSAASCRSGCRAAGPGRGGPLPPAAAEAEVGGDWYDVIPIPGGGVGLVMGDVAGKGLAAASMVGRLRSALRAYALEGHGPAAVVEQLNRLVWTELEESQMATLLYVVVDPAEGKVRWVNAGHLPPLLVVGSGCPTSSRAGARCRSACCRSRTSRRSRWRSSPAAPSCSTRTGWWSAPASTSTTGWPSWRTWCARARSTRRRCATTCSRESCRRRARPTT